MTRVLVTGATGFVGSALLPALHRAGYEAVCAVRTETPRLAAACQVIVVGDIGPATDWRKALDGVDCVIHLAARVHRMRDEADDPLTAFRHVNVDGTRRLAEVAESAGVGRMVFVSSIKAIAERGDNLSEAVSPEPTTPYGVSKLEAERALIDISRRSGLRVFILRPPLVYGPGVGANFRRLLDVVYRGWPLPLGGIRNRRSLIYVGNVVDALVRCISAPEQAEGAYLVHDGEPVSTPELIRRIASVLGRPARLLPVPGPMLKFAADLIGRREAWDRIAGSLSVDDRSFREAVGWRPPFTLDQGLQATAAWYCAQRLARER